MVRETVGTGDGAGVLAEVVATVVVVTVCVVYVDGEVVCADTSAAAAKKKTARDKFFTLVLDLGEIERFLILYMVREGGLKAKDRKGRVFGNPRTCGLSFDQHSPLFSWRTNVSGPTRTVTGWWPCCLLDLLPALRLRGRGLRR